MIHDEAISELMMAVHIARQNFNFSLGHGPAEEAARLDDRISRLNASIDALRALQPQPETAEPAKG